MRTEYDFSNAKLNPYVNKLRKQVSIKIDIDTIEYLKKNKQPPQVYHTKI
jgi:uncharacterized protein (DUF4415 family)